MSIIKKIAPYIVTVGLAASTLTGSVNAQTLDKKPTLEDAIKILNLRENNEIIILFPDNYVTSESLAPYLRSIAGTYAGTVKIEKIKDGYKAKGYYSELENPNEIKRVLKETDINGDKIIAKDELDELLLNVYKKYAK